MGAGPRRHRRPGPEAPPVGAAVPALRARRRLRRRPDDRPSRPGTRRPNRPPDVRDPVTEPSRPYAVDADDLEDVVVESVLSVLDDVGAPRSCRSDTRATSSLRSRRRWTSWPGSAARGRSRWGSGSPPAGPSRNDSGLRRAPHGARRHRGPQHGSANGRARCGRRGRPRLRRAAHRRRGTRHEGGRRTRAPGRGGHRSRSGSTPARGTGSSGKA